MYTLWGINVRTFRVGFKFSLGPRQIGAGYDFQGDRSESTAIVADLN